MGVEPIFGRSRLVPRHLRITLPAFTLSILLLVTGLLPVTSARADESMSQTPADQQVPADQADQKDAAQKADQTVSADALPTAQIGNGVVWDQAVVGNTVYVAGSFSTARPAGSAAPPARLGRSAARLPHRRLGS